MLIGGVLAAGWAIKEGNEFLENSSNFVKWGVAAGGLYIAYKGARKAKFL